jgi:hypothetical protein
MGIGKADTVEDAAKKVEQGMQIVDDYQVVIHVKFAAPELIDTLSAKTDMAMESKARWDAGGKELCGLKVVAPAPSSSWSARWAHTSSTSGWRITGARRLNTKS